MENPNTRARSKTGWQRETNGLRIQKSKRAVQKTVAEGRRFNQTAIVSSNLDEIRELRASRNESRVAEKILPITATGLSLVGTTYEIMTYLWEKPRRFLEFIIKVFKDTLQAQTGIASSSHVNHRSLCPLEHQGVML